MSVVALVGSLTLLFPEKVLRAILRPLVAFAAGSLIGSALFHMLPASVSAMGNATAVYVWLAAGLLLFFALEQFLHWHHCQTLVHDHRTPATYLVLVADGLHNLMEGIAVGGAFVLDVRLGMSAWIAAAVHEIPQELGDFGVLVQGGWKKSRALGFNLLSALAFVVGSLIAYVGSFAFETTFLIPFAAGNFLYIGAADLIPEVKGHRKLGVNLVHLAAFALGLALLLALRLAFGE